MDSLDLTKCLKKIARNKYTYGVFPCDKLPNNLRKPALIVANTHPSFKPGEHWVAFYFDEQGQAEYFDSYGMRPTNKYFKKFLNRNCVKYGFNRQRIQSDFTSVCGNYCCIFLYNKAKGISLTKMLNQFDKQNYVKNDAKAKDIFKKYFGQTGSGGAKIICMQTCKPLKRLSSK